MDAETKALALAAQLVTSAAAATEAQRTGLLAAAAALRQHYDHVPTEARSIEVRQRLGEVTTWATSATLDLLHTDPSWRVRSKAHAEIHDRRTWRFVRGQA